MKNLKLRTIGAGIKKVVQNAEQLSKAGNLLIAQGDETKHLGGVLLHTALEEAAKASFLFEKFLQAFISGKTSISSNERRRWLGGNKAHFQRIMRVKHLSALSEQMRTVPGISVLFPQITKELLNNRNSGLYVDYMDQKGEFLGPTDNFSPNYITASPSFVREVMAFGSYDFAVDVLSNKSFRDSSQKHDFVNQIEKILDEMHKAIQVKDKKVPFDYRITGPIENIFCIQKIRNEGISIIYTVAANVITEGHEEIFLMNNWPYQAHVFPTGNVYHFEIVDAPDPQNFGGLMEIKWRQITSK